MTAPRRRVQTRIAGLLATGALIVLGPASLAEAATTSATTKPVSGISSVSAGTSASSKAGEHTPNGPKSGHGKSKTAPGKTSKRHKSGSAKHDRHNQGNSHKPGNKHKHGNKSGPKNNKPKSHNPQNHNAKNHNPKGKRSNAPGSGLFHQRSNSPSAPVKSHGNEQQKPTKRTPNFRYSSSSSSSSSSTRSPHVQSSAPATIPSLTRYARPTPSSTPRPAATRAIAPAVAAPARATTPMTVQAAQPARTTSRTRPPAPAQPKAASSSAAGIAVGSGRPPQEPGANALATPVDRAISIPLGAGAQMLIGTIGIVGFALALAAIVTGYRGARRV